MGLTGFNRQRKRTLSSELGIDERLADRLLVYGYATPESVKKAKAEELQFLGNEDLMKLGKKGLSRVEDKAPDTGDGEDAESKEQDKQFLSLPGDAQFPYRITSGWHYLSNGRKINGKAKAEQMQANLDGG